MVKKRTATPSPTVLGRTLCALRKEQGFSQRQLAKRSGVHFTTIADLERGDSKSARLDTLRNLAAALGHPVSTLLGESPSHCRTTHQSA